MRDQYNFLKAIDTSSSSPELKESHRPHRQLAGLSLHHTKLVAGEAGSSSASSSSARQQPAAQNRAGLLKSKLQSLVRPRRLQLSSSGESKSSYTNRRPASPRLQAPPEAAADGQDGDDEDHPDGSDEELDEALIADPVRELGRREPGPAVQRLRQVESDTVQASQQKVPILCQIRKRALNKRAQLAAAMKVLEPQRELDQHRRRATGGPLGTPAHSSSNSNTNNNNNSNNNNNGQYATNQTSMSTAAPNYPSSETTKQLGGARQELAKCYDEIDQIYDYIRGLAPLPANLRKIKAIDFEQIERERQRYKSSHAASAAIAIDPRQVHHQHRQRYIKSIGSSSQSSAAAPKVPQANGSPQTSASGALKKLARVRQRVVAELIKDREVPLKLAGQTVALSPEKLQPSGPLPIKVTTKSTESQRPSIKRVESLNLGSNGAKFLPETRIVMPSKLASNHEDRLVGLSPRPNYLLSSAQQFRLPRAHSTSTLNKRAANPLDRKKLVVANHQKQTPVHNEPMPSENFPLVRLARSPIISATQLDKSAGSLGRSREARKRPSFESDLVESYVDDDEDEERPRREAGAAKQYLNPAASRDSSYQAANGKSSSSPSSSHRHGVASRNSDNQSASSSSSSGEDDDDEDRSASSSELWSYADESGKHQRLADKSHSDYDQDSASQTSETTATTTDDTSASDGASGGADAELRGSLGKETAARSSSAKRSPRRPTTSSSPSSGRPASPVDTTNESDEWEMISGGSRKSTSFNSQPARRQRPSSQPKQKLREEHIYEQIPAHKSQALSNHGSLEHQRQTSRARHAANLNAELGPAATPSSPARMQPNMINHPVAYAANVAANRRYQQQVAALFALQQQRDRNQQLVRNRVALGPPPASAPYHPNHHRRASTSSTQFMSSQAAPSSGPFSLNVGSLKWKHQASRQLADVPHRQRLSMGNIHLLSSAIPFANLISPKPKHQSHPQGQKESSVQGGSSRSSTFKAAKERRPQNANSLEDQEAGSTGTTNSTSSYEAAIKNSEPDPLRVEMVCPSDGEQSRRASSKRSIGSGSGSRSLTNHSHHSMQNNVQQISTLMKVPKLSKQSHLLQRPLPKPPVHSRPHASVNSKQPQKLSSTGRPSAPSKPTRSSAVNVPS